MMGYENPQKTKEWVKKLIAKPLPTLSKSGAQVIKAIQQDKLSYHQLGTLINQDPVLAFAVTSFTNQRMSEESEGCKNLEHAISMIGIEQLQQITRKIPVQKSDLKDMGYFYYARVLSSSLLAAQIAQTMAEIKKPQFAHDAYWSGLFFGAPLWYLWRFATPEMRLVRYAIRTNFKLPVVAENEILGTTVESISRLMVKQLKPSKLITDATRPDKQLTPRQWIEVSQSFDGSGKPKKIYDARLNLKLNDASFIITLANLIAGHAAHDWYSKTVLRYQKVLAVWLGVRVEDAIAMTHRCAAQMSQAHPFAGIMSPAAKLILPPRPRIKASEPNADLQKAYEEKTISKPVTQKTDEKVETLGDVASTQAAEIPLPETKVKEGSVEANLKTTAEANRPKPAPQEQASENKTPPRRGNKQIFDELTHIMLHQPENFTDLHELMNAATQGIAFGLGLHRATVALVNGQRTRLKAYYTVGTRDNPELGKFEIDLTKPSIFSRLIEKPASIWVKPDSSRKVWAMIPQEFKAICGSTNFFLMSVFVNKKPVAIFYADVKGEENELNEEDYKEFKRICGAAAHCLHDMAEQKKAKQTD